MMPHPHQPSGPEFLLGLPTLADGRLWRTALQLKAPVLISANALSVWRRDELGLRHWRAFSWRNLHLVWRHRVFLDGGGFVAAARYRGYPWSVGRYMDLCAAAPWVWFAAQDLCVEPEVAPNRAEVLDRISATVRLYRECRAAARDRGIEDRLLPVLQGHHAADYLRCLDRMPDLSGVQVVGVGSTCRRHVEGDAGILRVVDTLDRALGDAPTTLHLFGVKTSATAELSGHPRLHSLDSQTYGIRCRWEARKGGFAKTNSYAADVMADWYRQQCAILARPPTFFRAPLTSLPPTPTDNAGCLPPALARRLARAAEEMRELYEAGEVEWADLDPRRVWEWAFA